MSTNSILTSSNPLVSTYLYGLVVAVTGIYLTAWYLEQVIRYLRMGWSL